MTLPTTKPNDPDLPWYIAECMDLKKHLAIECAAKHEYLRMINELKVKAGFYEQEIARLRADKERLDYMEQNIDFISWRFYGKPQPFDLRGTIDAKRKEAQR
jgi:isocitrate/isopropylmalate dehydrogenase